MGALELTQSIIDRHATMKERTMTQLVERHFQHLNAGTDETTGAQMRSARVTGGKVVSMNPSTSEILATVLFGVAVLHTFCVKQFAHWAHQYPSGSGGDATAFRVAEFYREYPG